MLRNLAFAVSLLVATTALARERAGTIRYNAPKDDLDERPVATQVSLSPMGSDFGLKVQFDKVPWGDACKMRCANVTIFVDTDNSKATGLKLGREAKENGADLAITLKGTRDYTAAGTKNRFRVQARFLADDANSVDDGQILVEMDHERDQDRLQIDDRTVFVLVDGTSASLPSAKKARFIYHPPGASALDAPTRGMLASGRSGGIQILKGGK